MTTLQHLRRNITRQIKAKAARRFRDMGFLIPRQMTDVIDVKV